MAVRKIELRVAALEAEVAHLRQTLEAATKSVRPWWQEIYGTFANDPLYEEAMRQGSQYRESLRPKPAKRPSRRSRKQSTKRKTR